MSVVRPCTTPPIADPGLTAGSTTQSAGNVRVPGPGLLIAVAPAPDGMGMPPFGMPWPVCMRSRVIRFKPDRPLCCIWDTSRTVSPARMPSPRAPSVVASTISVSPTPTISSIIEKPRSSPGRMRRVTRSSLMSGKGGDEGQQHQLAGAVPEGVGHDHANLPKVRVDVGDLDLACKAVQWLEVVVRGADDAIGAG